MAFIDIDNFQQIVDQLGEEGSDRILKLYSELLKSAFRSDDIIGRFGADGFMLMLRRLMNRELIREKFGALCRQTFPGEVGMKITLSSSAGISFYPSDADGYDTLMQNVDSVSYTHLDVYKRQGADGTYHWAEMIAVPIQNQIGRDRKVVCTYRDIDDLKREREKRQNAELRFSGLVTRLYDFIRCV